MFDRAAAIHSLASVISPGQVLQTDFRLKIVHNGATKEVTFGSLLTRRTIVSVYMRNNTPSCDRQNDSLAAHAAEFDRAGYGLIAISRDSCASHARYAVAKRIGYVLASDPRDQFATAAGSLVEKSMYGRTFIGPARAAFVLDPDGTVLAVAQKVDTVDHAAQLRELLRGVDTAS
jgi:thioredoxin-dependent peroxiredoxin